MRSRFALLPVLALMPTMAVATTFLQQPFPDSVADAPVIVRGQVGRSVADWGKSLDGSKRIYTFYELKIAEIFKGSASGKTLAIRELGGVKNGVGMQVAGAARFEPGEDVVVFLGERNADGTHDVRGMMMGKYNLKQQADGTEVLVGPALAEVPAGGIVTDDAIEKAQGDSGVKSPWTLSRLRQLIDEQRSGVRTPETAQKPTPLPVVKSLPSPIAPVPAATFAPAPALQSPSPEEAAPPSGFWSRVGLPWILAAVVGVLAVFFGLRAIGGATPRERPSRRRSSGGSRSKSQRRS